MAALGVPGALWLAARRVGHAAVGALAYPVIGILLTTILLAYSRGSLVAVAVGAAVWFSVVPLRLRSAAALAAGAFGAGLVSLWAFGSPRSAGRDQPLPVRTAQVTSSGSCSSSWWRCSWPRASPRDSPPRAARRARTPRRRAGTALVVVLALVPAAGSSR
jgi:hypothetical protein